MAVAVTAASGQLGREVVRALLVSGNEDPRARIRQHRNVLEAAKTAGSAVR